MAGINHARGCCCCNCIADLLPATVTVPMPADGDYCTPPLDPLTIAYMAAHPNIQLTQDVDGGGAKLCSYSFSANLGISVTAPHAGGTVYLYITMTTSVSDPCFGLDIYQNIRLGIVITLAYVWRGGIGINFSPPHVFRKTVAACFHDATLTVVTP